MKEVTFLLYMDMIGPPSELQPRNKYNPETLANAVQRCKRHEHMRGPFSKDMKATKSVE